MQNINLHIPLDVSGAELANMVIVSGASNDQIFELITSLEREKDDLGFLKRIADYFDQELKKAELEG